MLSMLLNRRLRVLFNAVLGAVTIIPAWRKNMEHLGACLCGSVTFKVEGIFDRFVLCHCSRCRKSSGSAHGANLFSSTAKFEWLSGQAKVQTYKLPQSRYARCFCSICGSAMPFVSSKLVVVPAGCLDTRLESVPNAHIFVASRADWDKALERIPAFDAYPA